MKNFNITIDSRELVKELDLQELARLELYASTTTLTAIELEIYPVLVQAQVIANLMSQTLWEWKNNVPRRSGSPTRRKVEGIKQYIIHNFSFTHIPDLPGLDFYGTATIDEEEKRFTYSQRTEIVFNNLRELFIEGKYTTLSEILGVTDLKAHYKLSDYPMGTIPVWGNEIIDKMNAYRSISADQKGSGKCEALAALYASALIAIGNFPIEHIILLFTPTHVMTFLIEGEGYISSNKRMFSAVSLRNPSPHTSVVRNCLKNEDIKRILTCNGIIDILDEEITIPKYQLEKIYLKLEQFTSATTCLRPKLPQVSNKRFVPPFEAPPILNGAKEWRDYVLNMSKKYPGSVYDLARYAFREINVPYPEAYARAAKIRSPFTRRKAEKLATEEKKIRYIMNRMNLKKSLFGDNRLALPDETLIFGGSYHRDQALLLYAFLCHLSEEPYVVFGERNSYIWFRDKIIPISHYDESEKVLNIFNSYSHGTFSDTILTIGDITSHCSLLY